MPIFLRLAAFVGLWLFRKRTRTSSFESERISKLSWPSRINLVWHLVRDKRVSSLARGAAFLPVLYLISPIDLLPDFIPILGRLDDALVFGLVIDLMLRVVPASVLEEHLEKIAPKRD